MPPEACGFEGECHLDAISNRNTKAGRCSNHVPVIAPASHDLAAQLLTFANLDNTLIKRAQYSHVIDKMN